MRVRVLFFASLRDEVGVDAVTVELSGPASLDALFAALADVVGETAVKALQAENVRIAVNQQLVTPPLELTGEDEVAFLPPVTGG